MDGKTAVPEKRSSPRVAVRGHLRYRRIPLFIPELHNALVRDISRGGFGFRSDEPLSRKASLLVELHLPHSHCIHSLATVAWVKAMPEDDSYEVGGVFVEPTHEARAALETIVSEQ